MRSSRWHTAANVVMLAFVGLVAFSVSFVAIRAFALREGWSPLLASAAPLLVDTLTVLGASIVLARARDGERWRASLYGWALVAGASSVSLAVNVAHARAHLSAQLLAALPPVALLASAEAVLSEARRAQRRRATEPERAPAPAPRATLQRAPQRAPGRALAVVTDQGEPRATGRRAHAAEVFRALEPAERESIPQRAFAERAGISASYAAQVLPALRAEQGNGSRPSEQGGAG